MQLFSPPCLLFLFYCTFFFNPFFQFFVSFSSVLGVFVLQIHKSFHSWVGVAPGLCSYWSSANLFDVINRPCPCCHIFVQQSLSLLCRDLFIFFVRFCSTLQCLTEFTQFADFWCSCSFFFLSSTNFIFISHPLSLELFCPLHCPPPSNFFCPSNNTNHQAISISFFNSRNKTWLEKSLPRWSKRHRSKWQEMLQTSQFGPVRWTVCLLCALTHCQVHNGLERQLDISSGRECSKAANR